MKCKFFSVYILSLIVSFANCQKAPTNVSEPCVIQPVTVAIAPKLLTLSDAEKIMGEQAKLTCNTFIKKEDTLEYKCDYTALSQDSKTSKIGKLYFMYEIYSSGAAAANAYAAIYQANKGHDGVKVVSGLGSEVITIVTKQDFIFSWLEKMKKCLG